MPIAQQTEVRGTASGTMVRFTCRGNFAITRSIRHLEVILNTTARTASFPVPSHQRQDTVFAWAYDILKQAIRERVFPGTSVAVTHRGQFVALKGLGQFTYEEAAPTVTTGSIFDLASVSKVVATTTMAAVLYERGLLDLDAPVIAVVPEFARNEPRCRQVTFRMLLAHSSGLPAYEKLFMQAPSRDELLSAAFGVRLVSDPGTKAEYSDIGFIILGVALERIADEALDIFCQREIFGPLGMIHTTFKPAVELRNLIPPTVDDWTFRNRIIQGEVQDENSSAMGGVAGHAGVFSTAEDVAIFAHAMLNGGVPILRAETLAIFTKREEAPFGTSRALGWDTPSSPSQSGKYFSAKSFGHLGYTGTSLWIDPDRQLSVTLLTNRTWPDCKNQAVKDIRPRFHDAVVEALEANS